MAVSVLADSCLQLKRSLKIDALYIVSNDRELVLRIVESVRDIPVVVSTPNRGLYNSLKKWNIKARLLSRPLFAGINLIDQVKDLLVMECAEGTFKSDDKVLCLVSNGINALIAFDVKNVGIIRLKKEIEERVDIELMEVIFNLALEIAREGREGKPVGALFVIGDVKNVLKHSHQLIINPYEGHKKKTRDIKDLKNWETIKEFAQLDGAFIIDENGYALSSGRYLDVDLSIDIESGLGGRHLAAASISKKTKAIAVAVSVTGILRVYKDGEEIFKVSVV